MDMSVRRAGLLAVQMGFLMLYEVLEEWGVPDAGGLDGQRGNA